MFKKESKIKPLTSNSDKDNEINSTDSINKESKKSTKKRMLANESALSIPTAKRFMTFERRKSIWGYIFISPWIIGVIFFFVIPMIMASIYTFSEISIEKGAFAFKFIGFDNYNYIINQDAVFIKEKFTPSILSMLWQVPIIVFFSLFVAMLIKEKFFGRTLARAIFFLPVIVSSGVIIGILKENILNGGAVDTTNQAAYMFSAPSFSVLFNELGVPSQLTRIVEEVVKQIFDLTWKSGVQILLLLAAVNNIPSSSYEVADMEGATAWEKFWKITFPMVSPTLLVTIIYSVIDSFTDFQNPVMGYFMQLIKEQNNYAIATTVAFVYFMVILVIIGIVNAIISKRIFYFNE